MEKMLLDASSVVYALKKRLVNAFDGNYILDLTRYEVLNGIWKEAQLIKSISMEDAMKLVRVFSNALEHLHILSIEGLEEDILEKALKLGLPAYDASYIVAAEKHSLILATEDRKLREVASKTIRTRSLEE